LPEEPNELDPSSSEKGLQIIGSLRALGGTGGSASRFSGLFSSDSSSDEEDEDEDEDFDEDQVRTNATRNQSGDSHEDAGDSPFSSATASGDGVSRRRSQRPGKERRRPSTTEAKERRPLDDSDEDEDEDDLGSAMERKLHFGESGGPFADPVEIGEDSIDEEDDDDVVEIRPRRTS